MGLRRVCRAAEQRTAETRTGLRLWELGGRAADRGTPRLWLVTVQARELWEITAVQVMVPQVQTPRL